MYQAHSPASLHQTFPLADVASVFEDAISVSSRIAIRRVEDLVHARHAGRLLSQELGFSPTRTTLVTTIISELARNIVLYAGCGEIVLSADNTGAVPGILITALDHGPGIEDIERATNGGMSTSGGLGLGLTGIRQLADAFEVSSVVGEGTTVAVTVWRR